MLLFVDGFDHYGPVGNDGAALKDGVYSEAKLNTSGGVFSTNPRTGPSALRLYWTSSPSFVRRSLPFGEEDLVGGAFAFYLNSLPGDNRSIGLFQFRNVENVTLASVWLWSNGQVAIFAGEGSYIGEAENELIAVSTTPCVYPRSYQHFEAAYNPETGMEVRINGVTVANAGPFAGTDGKTAQVVIGGGQTVGFGGLGVTMDVDDFAVWCGRGDTNNDFLGDVKVYTRYPTSDGASQDWIPSAGEDGYPMLDNVPPQDATEYIEAGPLGSPATPLRSTFGVGDFPEEIVGVRGVMLASRMWKTDAGLALARTGVQVDAAEDLGENHALSTRPVWYHDVYELNPATASPWSLAAINDLDTVIERVE